MCRGIYIHVRSVTTVTVKNPPFVLAASVKTLSLIFSTTRSFASPGVVGKGAGCPFPSVRYAISGVWPRIILFGIPILRSGKWGTDKSGLMELHTDTWGWFSVAPNFWELESEGRLKYCEYYIPKDDIKGLKLRINYNKIDDFWIKGSGILEYPSDDIQTEFNDINFSSYKDYRFLKGLLLRTGFFLLITITSLFLSIKLLRRLNKEEVFENW